jgi:hypothetical protein
MQTAASEFDQGHSTCTCVLEYELNLVLEYGRTDDEKLFIMNLAKNRKIVHKIVHSSTAVLS